MTLSRQEALDLMARLDLVSKRPDIRARVYAVVEDPNQETWTDAHGLVLEPEMFTTLWQACVRHAGYPVTSRDLEEPWPEVPTRDQLLAALRAVLS